MTAAAAGTVKQGLALQGDRVSQVAASTHSKQGNVGAQVVEVLVT